MLSVNKFIKITIKSGIKATDGTPLIADFETYFSTEMSPMLATCDDVRKRVGHFISTVPDDTINQVILNNSLFALSIKSCGDTTLTNPSEQDPSIFWMNTPVFGQPLPDPGPGNWNYFASRYVTLMTSLTLLDNLDVFSGIQLGGFKKSLGDFEINKDPSWKGNKNTLVERLECELYKLEPAVRHCMPPLRDCQGLTNPKVRDYMASKSSTMTRGVNFPDYPMGGRRWWPTAVYPIATDKVQRWSRWYLGRTTPI